MSLEDDIAWNRAKAAETEAIIARVEREAETPSRAAELQILMEALGRYIMTAELLDAQKAQHTTPQIHRGARQSSCKPPGDDDQSPNMGG